MTRRTNAGAGFGAIRWVAVLICCLCAAPALASDGRWRLSIEGHQAFVFGEAFLGGGVRMRWEAVIEFRVRQGQYESGSGRARWLEPAEPISRPEGWFDCRQVEGSYLDSNLRLHETPRVRFAAFPVAGAVSNGRVTLDPGYEPPGNYLAVTYGCETDEPAADNWFGFAERGKQVLGKRQDVETQHDGDRRSARIREVASLPPEGALDLPLRDGWAFSQGSDDSDRAVRFMLRRLE